MQCTQRDAHQPQTHCSAGTEVRGKGDEEERHYIEPETRTSTYTYEVTEKVTQQTLTQYSCTLRGPCCECLIRLPKPPRPNGARASVPAAARQRYKALHHNRAEFMPTGLGVLSRGLIHSSTGPDF